MKYSGLKRRQHPVEEQRIDAAHEAQHQEHRAHHLDQVQRERQHAEIDEIVIDGERRAAADAPDFGKALGVDLEQAVVPADPLREPALHGSRALRY